MVPISLLKAKGEKKETGEERVLIRGAANSRRLCTYVAVCPPSLLLLLAGDITLHDHESRSIVIRRVMLTDYPYPNGRVSWRLGAHYAGAKQNLNEN